MGDVKRERDLVQSRATTRCTQNPQSAALVESIRAVLSYDPETGHFTHMNQPKVTHVRAGTRDRDGYISIRIRGRKYFAHRLAFLLMTGELPVGLMDHINRIRDDNRWCNLRPATAGQNQQNSVKSRRKEDLPRGVSRHKRKFAAVIFVNSKRIGLGTFETAEEASAAYRRKALELHGDFACFETKFVGMGQ